MTSEEDTLLLRSLFDEASLKNERESVSVGQETGQSASEEACVEFGPRPPDGCHKERALSAREQNRKHTCREDPQVSPEVGYRHVLTARSDFFFFLESQRQQQRYG